MRTSHRAALIALVLLLLAPGGASAATFCVHRPDGCVGTDAATLQAAFDAARANGSGRDTIRIGIGLFNDGPAVNEAGSPVDVLGVASNKTAIRSNSVAGGLILLDIREPTSTIADLRVHHATAAPTATGIRLAGEADRVMVTNQGITGQFDGIQMVGTDASLDESTVDLIYPRTTQNRALWVGLGADVTITDSFLQGAVGVQVVGEATILRTRVRADQGVVGGGGSTTTLRDSEVRIPGPMDSSYQRAALAAAGSGTTTFTAVRVTAVSKDRTGYGVWVVPNGGAGNNALVEMEGTVLHGFQLAVRLSESGGSNAALDTTWSAYDLSSTSLDAGSSYTTGAGMLDLRGVDPGFREAAADNYALRHDSPLIDAGDPAFQPRLFALDVRSLFRPRDGDGSGAPSVVDLGGHEYQHLAPDVVATADPLAAPAGTAVTFDASETTDADEDELTFSWAFDDGSVTTGARALHAFATAGQHSGTVTVTDVTGLRATATVVVDVAALAGPTPPGGQGPGGGANVAPRLTGLSVAPSSFRVGGRARARARARRSATRRVATGTTIRYTLSEAARVTFTVERAAAGRRVGRACARPTRANRGRRACTRWVVAGSFGVDGEQGANAERFAGRIGRRTLPPGRCRLRARARDTGGLQSPPVTSRAFAIVR